MTRTVAIAVAVVGMLFGAQVASAQLGGPRGQGLAGGEFGGAAGFGGVHPLDEPPHSVFNETIRRYRFDLGEAPVTTDTVEMFEIYHEENSDEKIIGAHVDVETNMLVVVAPPSAELGIRHALARLYVNRKSAAPQSLLMQKRELEYRRRELLVGMASLEIQSVGDEKRAEQLEERLDSIKQELNVVEKQLGIIVKYDAQLNSSLVKRAQSHGSYDPFGGIESDELSPESFGSGGESSDDPFE